MNYSRILITVSFSVPSNVSFRADVERGSIDVLSESGNLIVTVPPGETARAIFAFMNGEVVFPIVGNGILSIPEGWAQRQQARNFAPVTIQETQSQGFTSLPMDNPSVNYVPPNIRELVNNPVPPPVVTSEGPSRIDVTRIKERLGLK